MLPLRILDLQRARDYDDDRDECRFLPAAHMFGGTSVPEADERKKDEYDQEFTIAIGYKPSNIASGASTTRRTDPKTRRRACTRAAP